MNQETQNIKLRFFKESDSHTVEAVASDNELLTQVAHRAGVVIQQTCGGTPSCTDCRVIVKEGFENAFYPPEGPELRLLGNVYFITHERLSCQARVKGNCTLVVPANRIRKEKIFERRPRFDNKKSFNPSGGPDHGKKEKYPKNENFKKNEEDHKKDRKKKRS